MKYTSAEANKLLKKLNEERDLLIAKENKAYTFVAALSEDIESIRPDYDYETQRKSIDEISIKIRKLKHAINVFNTTTKVEGFDMTIDEMLVYIPQLSEEKRRLDDMQSRLMKERIEYGSRTNIIEYRIANYDIKKAAQDYERVSEILSKAQLALDKANTSSTLEF